MASRLVLLVVFGTAGFLSCLLVQRLVALPDQGVEAGPDPLPGHQGVDPLPGHSTSLDQQNLCDKADTLHALLSG